jgi:hypothetical protein
MIVVADTTPLNYLVLIGQIELLSACPDSAGSSPRTPTTRHATHRESVGNESPRMV